MSIAGDVLEEVQDAQVSAERMTLLFKDTLLKRISDHQRYHNGYVSITLEKDSEFLKEIMDELEKVHEIFEDTLSEIAYTAHDAVDEVEGLEKNVESANIEAQNDKKLRLEAEASQQACAETLIQIDRCIYMGKGSNEILDSISNIIAGC